MRYKVLHIPSGNSFQVIGAHAKTLDRFREEFKACLYYTVTPITPQFNVRHLKAKTKQMLTRSGFKYNRNHMDLDSFWMARFTLFAAANSLDVPDAYEVLSLRSEWKDIVAEEYEVMND